jgi:hypothetical protein
MENEVKFLENGQVDWLAYDFSQHEKFLNPNNKEDYDVPHFIKLPQIPQLVRELKLFYEAKHGNRIGSSRSAFYHGLNIIYLLWGNSSVEVCKNFKGKKVPNNYFLDNFYDLCKFQHIAFTGSASCAKTFTASIFGLVNFYACPLDPESGEKKDGTTIIFTTTAGSHAERRGWGDLKKLHRAARWDQCQMEQIGKVIEHLKCIVFADASIDEKSASQRDYRNGVLVVPVGQDKSGDSAYSALIGSKNRNIHWIIDEGPVMPAGIMDARINLSANPFFQLIMLGNATERTDPHGSACEPLAGWGSIDPAFDRSWEGKTMMVRFNHGEEGPNDLYLDKSEIKSKKDLPYPYLSNFVSRDEMAIAAGNGDPDYGRSTMHYMRMAVGFWSATGTQQTVLSEGFVKNFGADLPPELWSMAPRRIFAGFDPSFTSGGDKCVLYFIEVGTDIEGREQFVFDSDGININPVMNDKDEYRRLVAKRVVEICRDQKKMNIEDLGVDSSNDGGLMMQAIEKEWGKQGIAGISSQNESAIKKYKNKVSQYWLQIRDLIATRKGRGFNCSSFYAKDLFERRYTSDKGGMLVEPKKDMKKRIRRSPDYGDSAAYACHMVMRSGLITMETEKYKQSEEEIAERLREHRRLIYGRRDESLFASEFADSYIGDGYSY